jgi:hypothetical protein
MLVAAIWEGGGVAALALTNAGMGKSEENAVRLRLAQTPAAQRGMSRNEVLGAAAKIAVDLGHDYLGTEHQLLAIIADAQLSEAMFPAAARERAKAGVHELVANGGSGL